MRYFVISLPLAAIAQFVENFAVTSAPFPSVYPFSSLPSILRDKIAPFGGCCFELSGNSLLSVALVGGDEGGERGICRVYYIAASDLTKYTDARARARSRYTSSPLSPSSIPLPPPSHPRDLIIRQTGTKGMSGVPSPSPDNFPLNPPSIPLRRSEVDGTPTEWGEFGCERI